ncbi:MAG: epoxyqueuosine reductase QueH [Saccharofermentanales bacterium]
MKLLLHTCCAPCLEHPYQVLTNEGIEFMPYFFNPNIQPEWEYQRRRATLVKFSELNSCKVIFSDPKQDKAMAGVTSFDDMWLGFPVNNRCANCYRFRLENAARFAVENGYNAYTTTLMGSIYQSHDLISEIGNSIAKEYDIVFYNRDFRKGFQAGQKMAVEQGLYRQKYCGCICSLNESALKKKIIASIPVEFAGY